MFPSADITASLIAFFLTASSAATAIVCSEKFLNRYKSGKKNGNKLSLKALILFSLLAGILYPVFSHFTERAFYPNEIFIFPILIFYLLSISIIDFKTHLIPDIFPLTAVAAAFFICGANSFFR
jgi:hypothetical protein